MPLVLTLSQNAIPPEHVAKAMAQITAAFLETHGLTGNRVIGPNVTGQVHILPEGQAFAGGAPVLGAWLEAKVPAFALSDAGVQKAFFGQVTDILVGLSEGRLSPERIWTEALHTVDGTWNLNGVAHSNADLLAAIGAD
ncbi:4-oxalocrotonate tautomerase [Neogemmobacter tilapiae]|uniref:4-oxalocrotonate tautomerase n=1 Tax=Neogemmobacter tilapiae TaxID=875041 RepID=A0A918WL44_9RHOB|nr:4-oxalocrotonate tautomerase [Gemmobacter tilapiae]GHC61547.1 hypothetical protein GCM10007315_27000 [Gemmobacter tilapiae]